MRSTARHPHGGVVGTAVGVHAADDHPGAVAGALGMLVPPFRSGTSQARHAPAGRADTPLTGLGAQAHSRSQEPIRSLRAPSARWRQTQWELSRLHARVANLRGEALHQLTTRLAGEYGTVVVERLNVAGMVRHRRLARAIADSGMGRVRRLLAYKCAWAGGRLVEAPTLFASSKTCSGCGLVKAKLALSERVYRCQACGLELDRDENAARNLAALVQVVVAGSGSETLQNACVRDCQPTGDGGRSGNPDQVGTQQEASSPSGCEPGTAGWQQPAT